MIGRGSVVTALAFGALALGACGGSSGSSSDDGATTVAKTAPGGGVAVVYKDFTASPKTVTVKAGTPVTWTNKDDAPHNVVSTGGPDADKISSRSISNGDTYTFTPSAAGTIHYVCSIHPQMTGYTVVVTP